LPRAFHRIAVERLSVLDLSSVDQLAAVGLTLDDLAREDWSRCQAVAEAAHFSGFEGIMAPSAAGSGLVIAAFDDRAEHRLRVLGHEIIDTA
jgi:RES domain-containing protein